MDLSIPTELAAAYKKAGGKSDVLLNIVAEGKKYSYYRSSVNADTVTVEDMILLLDLAEKNPEIMTDADEKRTLRKMRAVIPMRQGRTKRTVNLEVMADAIYEYLKPMKRHWVFTEEDGQFVPWFVDEIEYIASHRDRNGSWVPARIHMRFKAKRRGKEHKHRIMFERGDLGNGSTAPELLARFSIVPETDEMIAKYEEELEKYEDYVSMTGELFLGVGHGKLGIDDDDDGSSYSSFWSRRTLDLERNGGPSKVVMDDSVEYGVEGKGENETVYVNQAYWKTRSKKEDEPEDSEAGAGPTFAPIQPYLAVFSMLTHEYVTVHVSNLTLYEYDKTLAEKLVIPEDHRELIDVLIKTKTKNSEDIVRGKKGGVVILCSGAPGTGKTLTSEVYSEIAERPLYTVQCAQLGVDASELEKELGRVLRRTQKWNAILQLDEADVYIHERGADVNQNAIVGVFLRLLEYFSGVLFMTTNRETVVDDAIQSRCIAHVRYRVPDKTSEKKKLWRIISTQYGVAMDAELVSQLVRTFPTISGRSIKQLCRLVQAMQKPPGLELFKWLAKFQDNIEIKELTSDNAE